MALDVEKAKAAGYSDAEIVDYLAGSSTLDVNKARAAGYSDVELLQHLTKLPTSAADQIPGQSVKAPPPKEETDMNPVLRGIADYPGSTEGIIGAAQALGGIGLHKLGFEETGKSQIEKGLGKMKEGEARTVSKETDSLTEAWDKGIGTVLSEYLPYQVGAGLANLGESLAFSGLGALAGTAIEPGGGTIAGATVGFLSKTMVKQGIKAEAENILKQETAKAVAAGATRAEAKQRGESGQALCVLCRKSSPWLCGCKKYFTSHLPCCKKDQSRSRCSWKIACDFYRKL